MPRSGRSTRPVAYRGMDEEVQRQLFMIEGRIAQLGWDLGEVWHMLLQHQEQLDALQASPARPWRSDTGRSKRAKSKGRSKGRSKSGRQRR